MDKRAYPEKGRERIQASLILNRLNKHALGEAEMTATQIQAARILLAKVLPDLKQTENKNENENKHSYDVQSAEQAFESLRAYLLGLRD